MNEAQFTRKEEPITTAGSLETVVAHVNEAKEYVNKIPVLAMDSAWEIYSKHPERATPATVNEQDDNVSTEEKVIEEALSYIDSLSDKSEELIEVEKILNQNLNQ